MPPDRPLKAPAGQVDARLVTRGALEVARAAYEQLASEALALGSKDPQAAAEHFMQRTDSDPLLMRAVAMHQAGILLKMLKGQVSRGRRR